MSFNGGEGSPYLRRQLDFAKTASTCEVMRNFLPLPFGGVTKRPGTDHLINTHPAGLNSKAFPFVASNGDKYVVHFTLSPNQKVRIYRANGTIADTLDFFPTHTFTAGLRDLQIEQVNDVAFFTHPEIHPFMLVRRGDSNWRLPFVDFSRAPMLDENLKPYRQLTVTSNPRAANWVNDRTYFKGDVVFQKTSEWQATAGHTSEGSNNPGVGIHWRDFWSRKLYLEGDPIAINARDRHFEEWVQFDGYGPMDVVNLGVYNPPLPEDPWFGPPTPVYYICAETGVISDPTDGPGGPEEWQDRAGEDVDWYRLWNNGSGILGQVFWYGGAMYQVTSLPDLGDPPFLYPPGANWTNYWSLVPGTTYRGTWGSGDRYFVGTKVERKGHVYECIQDHIPLANTKPGAGADWEDFWVEVSIFLPVFDISDVSPGTYWRISPERDETDFQIEMRAIEDNDDKKSDYIVVDGGWNFYTFGVWYGTYHVQRSVDNAKTWDTIRSYQSSGDRNVAEGGFETEPVLLRLRFVKETNEAETDTAAEEGQQRGLLVPETRYVTGEGLMTEYVDADEMHGFARTPMLSGTTAKWSEGAFSEAYGFPKTLALHEARIFYAGTTRNPVSLWGSASDDFTNFAVGVKDDAAIFETLPVGNQSPIRWLASQRRLFLGTSLQEFVVGSETSDQPLTPTNFFVRGYTGTGSVPQRPVRCPSGLLFAGRKGGRLYELQYTTEDGYEATDLSRLAEHLTASGIVAMAWQQTREPGLWAVTADGALLYFSYSRSERVFAWSRHDTSGGLFRDVVVLPSDSGDDGVFLIVDRAGGSKLERFPQHWRAAQESGAPVGYQDGAGAVSIVSELVSLPVDLAADNGTTQARKKRPHKICLDLYQSQGGEAWNRDKTKRQQIPGAQAGLVTGWVEVIPDAGVGDDMQLKLYHDADAPFTLRGAVIRWELNER